MAESSQSTQKTEVASDIAAKAANNSDAASAAGSGTAPVADTAAQVAEKVAEQAVNGAATAANSVPMPMESAFTWSGYIQAIGTLLILLAVLYGVVWLVRKYGRFNFLPKPGAFPRDGLRLESQLPLGPRKGLMVVRFLNKRLLLGVTDHQITLLKETADDEDENNMDFKDVMDKAQRQKSDDEFL